MNDSSPGEGRAGHDQGEKTARAWPEPPRSELVRYGGAVSIVGACTGAATLMYGRFELSDLTMVYLLGSVLTGVAFGRGPAAAAAVLSVAAFNFGFVPPRFTFQVAEAQYLVTFAVMLTVAVLTGTLTARLREQLDEARVRERRTAALHRLSHELVSRSTPAEVLEAAVERIGEILGARVAVVRPETAGDAAVLAGDPALVRAVGEQAATRRAFDTGQIAGLEHLVGHGVLHLPLEVGTQRFGVICAQPAAGAWSPARFQLLRVLASQTALALERCRLTEEAQAARAQADMERSRNALLSSVSHDLRTPLAAITGAATSMRDGSAQLDDSTRRELADTIAEEAQRLNRLIGNILDITRLESGMLRVRKEWHSLEELVGAALVRLEVSLGSRTVQLSLPPSLPFVPLDDVLFEQALSNLIENAHKYSPAELPIEIRARVEGEFLGLEVADRGPGLPVSAAARLFEKFYRGSNIAGAPGAGLGLAICRGIVEAHGGTVSAANRRGGGAVFTVRIPIEGTPPNVECEDSVSSLAGAP